MGEERNTAILQIVPACTGRAHSPESSCWSAKLLTPCRLRGQERGEAVHLPRAMLQSGKTSHVLRLVVPPGSSRTSSATKSCSSSS